MSDSENKKGFLHVGYSVSDEWNGQFGLAITHKGPFGKMRHWSFDSVVSLKNAVEMLAFAMGEDRQVSILELENQMVRVESKEAFLSACATPF